MATIFGSLDIADNDRVFTDVRDNSKIFAVIDAYIARYNEDVNKSIAVFTDGFTEDRQTRFDLAATGIAPEGGFEPKGKPENVKVTGSYDVAFSLRSHDEGIGGNRVAIAYMNARELQKHVDGIMQRNAGRKRHDVLKGILNNVNETFVDNKGSLTIRRLANADGTVYWPVLGSNSELTAENHYLASGYIGTAISDTNNPLVTLREEIVEHWGRSSDGYDIVVFCNPAQAVDAQLGQLTGLEEVPQRQIAFGANADLGNVFDFMLPGAAYAAGYGVYVQMWDWIPADYLVAIHMGNGIPRPLQFRSDPSDTGLAPGLQMIERQEDYPNVQWFWDDRYGYGAWNRLGAAVMKLTAGAYDIPSPYDD